MCIIVVKPKGIELPSEEILKNCFDNNKDGAGYMYWNPNKISSEKGAIVIRKGFMTFGAIKESLSTVGLTKDHIIVYHFRIATHGGISPENTHPFPVEAPTNRLKALKVCTDLAVAHNGILAIKPKTDNMSDTQEFIQAILSQPLVRNGIISKDEDIMRRINEELGTSRLCILDRDRLSLLGKGWIREESSGIMFSNASYEAKIPYRYYTSTEYKWDETTRQYYRLINGSWMVWDYITGKYTLPKVVPTFSIKEYKRSSYNNWMDRDEENPFRDMEYEEEGEYDSLKEILEGFLYNFTDSFKGSDTKWDWEYALNTAFDSVKDKLVVADEIDWIEDDKFAIQLAKEDGLDISEEKKIAVSKK